MKLAVKLLTFIHDGKFYMIKQKFSMMNVNL